MAEVQIQKMRITHEQILNWLLLNPEKSQGECAKFFNVTEPWLSVIINSDVFQQRYLEKRMMMDRRVTDVLEAKARDVVDKGLDRLAEIIPVATDPRLILDTTDKLLGRLGYGPKTAAQQVNVQTNVYAISAADLAQARASINAPTPAPQVEVLDAEVVPVNAGGNPQQAAPPADPTDPPPDSV